MINSDNEEIIILVLHCARCRKSKAWVSVFEGNSPPACCRDCEGQLSLVHGQEAASICMIEADQWGKMARHALAQADLNLRFKDALISHAFGEQGKKHGC